MKIVKVILLFITFYLPLFYINNYSQAGVSENFIQKQNDDVKEIIKNWERAHQGPLPTISGNAEIRV
jgi:hypothetical protein